MLRVLIGVVLLGTLFLVAPVGAAPPSNQALIQRMVPGGKVISGWGAPRSGGRFHQGIDIQAPAGTTIRTLAGGTVTSAGWDTLGGNTVLLRDRTGRRQYFAHLIRPSALHAGQRIADGAIIGYVGQTGDAQGTVNHLHWQLSNKNGAWVDPLQELPKLATDLGLGSTPPPATTTPPPSSPQQPPPAPPHGGGVRIIDPRALLQEIGIAVLPPGW